MSEAELVNELRLAGEEVAATTGTLKWVALSIDQMLDLLGDARRMIGRADGLTTLGEKAQLTKEAEQAKKLVKNLVGHLEQVVLS